MERTGRTLVAVGAAAMVLVIAAWFDDTGMRDAVQAANRADVSGLASMTALGSLLVAGAVLLLGVLAWRSASLVVGVAYIVVGGFFAAQMWLWWNLASAANNVLPEALAVPLRSLFDTTQGHGLNATATIGASMVLAGAATLLRWWRGRAVAGSPEGIAAAAPSPTLP